MLLMKLEVEMTYWRMQLHPGESELAAEHTIQCVASGFIGLDFGKDVGDMRKLTKNDLPKGHRSYLAFAQAMKPGDIVLVFVHNYPFALLKVKSKYHYITSSIPEIGIWPKHFRRVELLQYYHDYIKDPRKWKKNTMTETLTPLRDRSKSTYLLINEWLNKLKRH
jgi:hypothetical protein